MTLDHETVAARLLRSSERLSHDPPQAIDWDRPVDTDRYAAAPERLSLYGTDLWGRLTEEQRKELSRHEVASIASAGIWFEAILMQMLIRRAYDRDPSTSSVRYAYIEIADECRHSVMFARFAERLGGSWYRPDPLSRLLGKVLKSASDGVLTFAATLFVEELLDQMQREAIADERLEPLTRAVSRIHVAEEARHMRFAREELATVAAGLGPVRRAVCRWSIAFTAYLATTRLIDPRCYAAVGLEPRQARQAARRNPHWRASTTWFARRAVTTFRDAGLLGGSSVWLWRKAGLLER